MDIEYFVENGDFKLVSVERVKCMKGNIVPPIWKELKEFVLNKFSNVETTKENIIRVEYEFKFLIDLYNYFREGYESDNLLCFTKGKKIEDISLEEYKKMLDTPTKELEAYFDEIESKNIAERLKTKMV